MQSKVVKELQAEVNKDKEKQAELMARLEIKTKDREIRQLAKKKPKLCYCIQPWKNYTAEQYDQMCYDFLKDMEGCVYQFYYTYRHANLIIEEAFQDAYETLDICIEKDAQAPTITSEHGIKCEMVIGSGSNIRKCGTMIPGTKQDDPPHIMIRDTDGRINSECTDTVAARTFVLRCPSCGHTSTVVRQKALFCTLFFGQVRGKIQGTVRQTALKHPSWDALVASSGSLNEPAVTVDFETSGEMAEDLAFVAMLFGRIEKKIEELPRRHSQIIRLHMKGYKQSEIADELHISKQRVCSVVKNTLLKFRTYYTEEDMIRYCQIINKRK